MYVAKIAILYRFYCKKSHVQHWGGGVRVGRPIFNIVGEDGERMFIQELNASNFLLARDVE